MIYELIAEIMERTGRLWKIKGGKEITPDAEDVKIVLDEAAKRLYDSHVGDSFETGGIIVTKGNNGLHHVYTYVGDYN